MAQSPNDQRKLDQEKALANSIAHPFHQLQNKSTKSAADRFISYQVYKLVKISADERNNNEDY
jgi:hypothetical protein